MIDPTHGRLTGCGTSEGVEEAVDGDVPRQAAERYHQLGRQPWWFCGKTAKGWMTHLDPSSRGFVGFDGGESGTL